MGLVACLGFGRLGFGLGLGGPPAPVVVDVEVCGRPNPTWCRARWSPSPDGRRGRRWRTWRRRRRRANGRSPTLGSRVGQHAEEHQGGHDDHDGGGPPGPVVHGIEGVTLGPVGARSRAGPGRDRHAGPGRGAGSRRRPAGSSGSGNSSLPRTGTGGTEPPGRRPGDAAVTARATPAAPVDLWYERGPALRTPGRSPRSTIDTDEARCAPTGARACPGPCGSSGPSRRRRPGAPEASPRSPRPRPSVPRPGQGDPHPDYSTRISSAAGGEARDHRADPGGGPRRAPIEIETSLSR